MKKTLFILFLLLSFFRIAHADEMYASAKEFSQQYQDEMVARQEEKSIWQISAGIRGGVLAYREDESNIASDFQAGFSEFACSVVNEDRDDFQKKLNLAWAQSAQGVDRWYSNSTLFQSNHDTFHRFNVAGSIGKILYSEKYKNAKVVPYLGYGFRYINFDRKDFVIDQPLLIRQVASEKEYIHHLDVGISVDYPLYDKWTLSGLASYGYPFYAANRNSAIGSISGSGGTLLNADVSVQYALTDSWKVLCGGFADLQELAGTHKGDVIWPKNNLDAFGGSLRLTAIF